MHPAAMRYTEARLHKMAEEMLADLEKNTVDFTDNFDGSLQEPPVLPARLPNLLLNGSSGIAVGMATNIPPHNLKELAAAIIYLINNYDTMDEIPIEFLMKFIPGPDFPTGGIIVGTEGIEAAYGSGKGRIVLRGKAHIEEMTGNRHRIVITEIPYQVNKSTLIERIADLVREEKIDAISDLRDESDRRGMSIVIELKRGAQPKKVLNQLYKYTALQTTFGVQMLALVDGEPRLLPLKQALQIFIEHRQTVITRRTQFELEKARARAHILEGLTIALNNLDAVIQTIRESPDADVAKERLMKRFKLSELQAQAILDMQLRRLAALERQKIEDEYKQVKQQIAHLEDLLAHPKKILALIQDDLRELSEKYGDERRTHIAAEAVENLSEADLVPDEAVLIILTARGYVKRVAASRLPFAGDGRQGRDRACHQGRGRGPDPHPGPFAGHDAVLLRPGQGLLRKGLPDPGCRPGRQGHPAGERPVAGAGRDHHRRRLRAELRDARNSSPWPRATERSSAWRCPSWRPSALRHHRHRAGRGRRTRLGAPDPRRQ